MKKLIMVLPLVAGCATAPMASVHQDEVESLRAEVESLRSEIEVMKAVDEKLKARVSLRKFVKGKRVLPQPDLRRDLPKGVAR